MALFRTGVLITGDAQGGVRAFNDASAASDKFNKNMSGGRMAAVQMGREIDGLRSRVLGLAGAYVSAEGVRSIIRISDEYKQLKSRLDLVTDSSAELAQVQTNLFQLAQDARAPYSAVAGLYADMAASGEDLQATQQEMLAVTSAVGSSLVIAGRSAEQASGAIFQLGQLFGGSVVQAQEYNSLIDNMRPLLAAVAKNIEGTGGTVAGLTKLVKEGKVPTADFFEAAVKGSAELTEAAQSMEVTVGQAFTRLQNDFKASIGSADTTPLVASIEALQATLADPAVQEGLVNIATAAITLAEWTAKAASGVSNLATEVGELAGAFTQYNGIDQLALLSWMVNPTTLPLAIALLKDTREEFNKLGEATGRNHPAVKGFFSDLDNLVAGGAPKALAGQFFEWGKGAEQASAGTDKASDSVAKFQKNLAEQVAEQRRVLQLTAEGVKLSEAETRARMEAGGATKDQIDLFIKQQAALKSAGEQQDNATESAKKLTEQNKELAAVTRVYQLMLSGGMSESDAQYQVQIEAARELGGEIGRVTEELLVQKRAVDNLTKSREKDKDAAEKHAEQVRRAYERTAEGIEEIFRALYLSSFDGFEGFLDQAKDSLKRALVEMALVATRNTIIIPLMTQMGGAMGLPQQALSGITSALGGGDGNLSGLVGGLGELFGQSAGDELAGNMLGLGSQFGATAGASFASMLPGIGAGLTGLYMAGAGLAVKGSAISEENQGMAAVLSGGYSLFVSAFDNVAGGNVFGTKWKTAGQTLAINIEGAVADATLTTLRSRKRALGGGTKRRTRVDDVGELDAQITDVFGNIYDSVEVALNQLGMEMVDFDFAISLDTKGKTEEEIAALIEGAITDATNSLLRAAIPGIDNFQAEGEELGQTFERLVNGVAVVREAIDLFGFDTLFTRFDGFQLVVDESGVRVEAMTSVVERSNEAYLNAANSLTQMAGGVDQLQANISGFYNAFASDSVRFENNSAAVNELFAGLGLAVPASSDALWDLVQGIDIFSESGQEAFNALTAANPLLKEFFDSIENFASTGYAVRTRLGLNDGLDPARQAFASQGLDYGAFTAAAEQGMEPLQRLFAGLSDQALTALAPFIDGLLTLLPGVNQLDQFLGGIQRSLDRMDMSPLEIQLDDIRIAMTEQITTATQMGASERELDLIRRYAARQSANVIEAEAVRMQSVFDQLAQQIGSVRSSIQSDIQRIQSAQPGFSSIGSANARITRFRGELGQGDTVQQIETINGLRQAIVDRYDAEVEAANAAATAQQAAMQAQQQTADAARQAAQEQAAAAQQLLDYVQTLGLAATSPLTAFERLAEAQANYERALAGNDLDALQQAADAYLQENKAVYGVSDTAVDTFGDVRETLRQRATSAGTAAQAQLISAPALEQAVMQFGADINGIGQSALDELSGLDQMLADLLAEGQAQVDEDIAEMKARYEQAETHHVQVINTVEVHAQAQAARDNAQLQQLQALNSAQRQQIEELREQARVSTALLEQQARSTGDRIEQMHRDMERMARAIEQTARGQFRA